MNRKLKLFFILLIAVFYANILPQKKIFKNPFSERIANYNIDVTLDVIDHKLTGKEILNWKNTSTDTIKELRFHLYLNAFKNNRSTFMIESGGKHRNFEMDESEWGWCKISSVKIPNGNNLTDKTEFIQPDDTNRFDQTVMRIFLNNPLPPGKEINLEIKFTSKLPKIFARTGFSNDFYLIGQWFPKIGVYESARKLGTEKGRWNCHQFHRNSEFYADFGVYNVNITLPEKFIVGATGVLQKTTKTNGTKTLLFRAEDVIDFAWTAFPKFIVKKRKWKHVEIKLLLPPEHLMFAERYLNTAVASLEYLDEHVGKYPYTTLTIVDPPFNAAGAGGMEYPTFITGTSIWGLPKNIRAVEIVTAHEFSHNYFMGMLASNEFEEPWLDEGFTQYFETKIMDATYGKRKSVINLLGFNVGDFELTRSAYVGMNNPAISSNKPFAWEFPYGAYGILTYNKTATWLTTLERMLGKKTFEKIIKTYFNRWSFKHPTGKDFINIVNEIVLQEHGTAFGKDMNWFFDQVLYGSGICDYKVTSILNRRISEQEGIFNDSLVVSKENIEPKFNSEVTVHRAGEIKLPVDVLIHFNDGNEIFTKWNGKARSKTYKFKNVPKIDWVKVDPKNKIALDINLTNNALTVKPEKKVVEKYTVKFLFWLENVMTTLGTLF